MFPVPLLRPVSPPGTMSKKYRTPCRIARNSRNAYAARTAVTARRGNLLPPRRPTAPNTACAVATVQGQNSTNNVRRLHARRTMCREPAALRTVVKFVNRTQHQYEIILPKKNTCVHYFCKTYRKNF